MSKREVLQRKKELQDDERHNRQEAANRAAIAKMQAAAKAAPFMRILADGVYANGAWIAAKLGPLPSGWVRGIGAVEVEVPGPPGGTIPCSRVQDLEEVFDSGRQGTGVMGVLEVFTITSFADLSHGDRQLLGTEHTRGMSDPVRQGLMDRFKTARVDTAGRPSIPSIYSAGEVPIFMARFAWACVDGDPGQGQHATLENCLPLEVGYSHRQTVLLWVRSLSHIPAMLKRTELGRARNRLERAERSVSDSQKGRAYLRELEVEVRALEVGLAGGTTSARPLSKVTTTTAPATTTTTAVPTQTTQKG